MKIFSLCLLILLILAGYQVDSPANLMVNSPNCLVTSKSKINIPSFGYPSMSFTVENNGDRPTATSVGVWVRLKNDNHIVDESGTVFGTLYDNESKSGTVNFYELKKGVKVNIIEIKLYWYDAEDGYYYSKTIDSYKIDED